MDDDKIQIGEKTMAVLNRETFFSRLNEMVGNNSDEQHISFIEDMTDTYNDMEKRASGDGVNWEQKYHDNDRAWRERYSHRFFSGNGNSNTPEDVRKTEDRASTITVDDLFVE